MPLRYRFPGLFALLLIGLSAPSTSVAQCDAPTVCIPQPTCVYISPDVASYPASGAEMRNLVLRDPSHCEPPPPPGVFLDSFFDVFYEIELRFAPGQPFGPRTGSTTGTIRMMQPAPDAPIELELLAMELVSAGPPTVRIRESPSRPSLGRQVSSPQGGGYHIDSFFDVFTEISFDGGQTWDPSPQPQHVRLVQDSPTPVKVSTWGTVKGLYR